MKPINLVCLPFAGGNKYSYREYENKAPSFIKVVPVEYPGRGARMREPLLRNMNVIVDDLYRQIRNSVDLHPYAIYGHSMGGLAAFLLTQKLLRHNHRSPVALFITGTTGPSAPTRGQVKRHTMGKDEFIQEIIDLDGMPGEILQSKEMMEYFEPILRADFTATETYVHEEAPILNIPMTVITGTEEDMNMDDIMLWQKENVRTIDFRQMPGKHFFIFHHADKIVEIIADQLVNNIKICQP